LDHFDHSNPATLSLRYWDTSIYEKENGPVFLFICGEYTCPGIPFPGRLFPLQMAEWVGARFFMLEHRYYGKS
jgi:hypothetical protein